MTDDERKKIKGLIEKVVSAIDFIVREIANGHHEYMRETYFNRAIELRLKAYSNGIWRTKRMEHYLRASEEASRKSTEHSKRIR